MMKQIFSTICKVVLCVHKKNAIMETVRSSVQIRRRQANVQDVQKNALWAQTQKTAISETVGSSVRQANV